MKIILILLLSINTALACGTGSQAELNSCTVEDKFFPIFNDLYPDHIKVSELHYSSGSRTNKFYFDEDNAELVTLYDRLVMEDKPLLSVFQAKLDEWRAPKIARLDFRDSVIAIDRFRRRAELCSLSQPNMAILRKRIIKNMDSVKRDCLLSHTATLDAEDSALSQKETQIQNAKDRMKARDCSTLSGFQRDVCILLKR